jgi:hypothetical protein
MSLIVGLVDRPIADDAADNTYGYTRTEWLRGEGIVGGRIDFEHGKSPLKSNDLPLGTITRTFISQEPDGDWLAIEGRMNRGDVLVDALRMRANSPKGLGFSIRYKSRVETRANGQRCITGKTLEEISLHRTPHHASALVQVCQGKDSAPMELELEQPLQHWRFPDTKAPDAQKLALLLPALRTSNNNMAAAAAPMDTTPPAAAPPAAAPPPAARSDLVERAEMMAKLQQMEELMKAQQVQLDASKAKEESEKKLLAEKAAAEKKAVVDKRRADFMAQKDFHADNGINMEDENQKKVWDAIFEQDSGDAVVASKMKAFENSAKMKAMSQKMAEQAEALAVFEKRLRPASYQSPSQPPSVAVGQPLIANKADVEARMQSDPALQQMKASIDARRNGLHPLTLDLARQPALLLPTLGTRPQAPASMATGGATTQQMAAGSRVSTMEVAQGLKGSEVHTGDAIQTKHGLVYVERGVDDKTEAWNRSMSTPGHLVDGMGRAYNFEEMGIAMTPSLMRSLQNTTLNAGCGWGMKTENYLSKKANSNKVIEVKDHSTY